MKKHPVEKSYVIASFHEITKEKYGEKIADIIKNNFGQIKAYANVIEDRIDDEGCTIDRVLQDNARYLALAIRHKVNYLLIEDSYDIDLRI